MANKKISDLTAAAQINAADLMSYPPREGGDQT